MTRVLLSGASGFVGSHVLRHLLANTDWEITCPVTFRHRGNSDRIASALAGNDGWHRRVRVVICDLAAPVSETTAARFGPVDEIWNVASDSHVDRSITEPASFTENNVSLMLNLLDYARKARPRLFLQMSTDEVYGPAPGEYRHREWDRIAPSNPYCVSMGTDIVTRRGLVPIEDFSVTQHRTLSRDAATSNVPDGLARRTWQFPHTGEMLRIRVREGREEITCTEEHKFFARVNSHASGGTKMVERRAADLSIGDRVCVIRKLPFPPDALEPEPEYARLLGYWIADGSYSDKRSRYVRLADQDRSMIDFYREQAQAICGVSPKSKTGAFGNVYKHGTKDCWYLQFASAMLRDRIDLADRMNVIDQALNFGPQALGQFVAGWIDGDGSVAYEKGLVKRVDVSCCDPRLRRQLKFLLRRLGVIAIDDSDWDRLSIHDARSLMALYEAAPTRKWRPGLENGTLDFRTPQRKPGRAQNWMWARVESIERVPSDGKVYDLEVGKYHNYLASYFLVHNSASKACQEAISFAYWRTYKVPVVISNTMNIIGQMQDAEKMVPKTIRSLIRGEPAVVHASPEGIPGSRFYLHARNLADAWLWISRNQAPQMYPEHDLPLRYHVVGEREITNTGLVNLIGSILGIEPQVKLVSFHESRPGHDLRYALDGRKLADAGWAAPVPLDESLRETVQWSVRHPAWLGLGPGDVMPAIAARVPAQLAE